MAANKDNTKKLTRFEKARVLGARAIQLSMGAKPMKHKEIEKFLEKPRFFAIFFFQSIDKWKKIGYNSINLKHLV